LRDSLEDTPEEWLEAHPRRSTSEQRAIEVAAAETKVLRWKVAGAILAVIAGGQGLFNCVNWPFQTKTDAKTERTWEEGEHKEIRAEIKKSNEAVIEAINALPRKIRGHQ
jgi:hypothetical protein